MQLIEALRYSNKSCLVFVGAGGKTTAIFRVARELLTTLNNKEPNDTILVTTTTHFGDWQPALADYYFKVISRSDVLNLEKNLPRGIILLTGEKNNNRLGGLTAELLDNVHRLAEDHHLPLLIEADGSHLHPLKAPAEHEPVIPQFAEHVIVVAGLIGLGKPLTNKWVHRPEKFSELSGLRIGEEITSEALVKVLLDSNGGLKNIPTNARRTLLLNQADSTKLQSQAKMISTQVIPDYQSSIITSLLSRKKVIPSIFDQESDLQKGIHAVKESIAGIILAAGGSSRFGKPKQLLVWKGQPLIRHVAIAALAAGLSPVLAIVGSSAEKVQLAISDLPVRIVNNTEWKVGLSSSIKAGIGTLPKAVGGAIFMQADQPQVSPQLINSLVAMHQSTLKPIIAPQIDGQRGNPILFDLTTFTDLCSLEGDIGGRALFSKYPVQWVIWHDPNLLIDIDTIGDYERFLEIFPEGEKKV
jgi:molybdenum cofactor cytidylyltransferase